MLTVQSLSKSYDARVIIKDFSLYLPQGSFTALVGPSGCGKSTLFSLLMGLTRPDGGAIFWHGKPIENAAALAAMMLQEDLLLPWLTLRENALLPLRTSRRLSDRTKKETDEILSRLGLAEAADRLPSELSGGMRQRGALARTLAFDRELILLDEPLSALDAITRQELWGVLEQLQSRYGKTVLMITHDVEEALVLSDRLLVLSRPPMTIRWEFSLEIPRPRARSDPQIVALREQIIDLLRGEMG